MTGRRRRRKVFRTRDSCGTTTSSIRENRDSRSLSIPIDSIQRPSPPSREAVACWRSTNTRARLCSSVSNVIGPSSIKRVSLCCRNLSRTARFGDGPSSRGHRLVVIGMAPITTCLPGLCCAGEIRRCEWWSRTYVEVQLSLMIRTDRLIKPGATTKATILMSPPHKWMRCA